ncbi:hypothetical protein TcasGA2_TC004943 [Tribolium castaneum]|uniref:Uncharacterized protein n=1 Tax=Tribolium castaneum TaxID=7070 RepID=D6WCW2_TRICA|nr:hypothetical protein TcasGA2_TC004943 [Tribolium castaneum]
MDRIHLTDKFKQLQIGSLQTMPSFVGDCILFINANPVAVHVVAGNGVLSVTPFPLFPMGLIGFQVPAQYLDQTQPRSIVIALTPGLRITLWFKSKEEKWNFIGFLNLPENLSSSDETGSSDSRSNPSTGPSTDSGIIN